MKITVVGAGYVGLVSAACFAELGNAVVCVDRDAARVALLSSGEIPLFEPGLKDLVVKNLGQGRIRFTADIEAGVRHAGVLFIAVGTPSDASGGADICQVLDVARDVGRFMTRFLVVVNKSTVPVGTADKVREAIAQEVARTAQPGGLRKTLEFAVVSNPEFLKEGAAVEDFMRPDRVVIGVGDDAQGKKAERLMRGLYAPFNRNRERTLVMDVRSAELTKYAANAMLATKISFMNDMANLAEVLGADIEKVRQGIGSDRRIGYDFIYAGLGYGGSCFPKDVDAICHTAREVGLRMRVVESVRAVNAAQKQRFVDKVLDHFGGSLQGKTIAVWGLTFKPHTDDVREAPSLHILRQLVAAGANVRAHDPVIRSMDRLLPDGAKPRWARSVRLHGDPMAAAQGADALVIVTEWKVYRSPDFSALRKGLRAPVVFDGRNLFDPLEMKRLGFSYHGVGRGCA